MLRLLQGVGLWAIDALICLTGLLVAALLLTGGGYFRFGTLTIAAHSPDNSLLALAVLLAGRFPFRHRRPFLGIDSLSAVAIEDACDRWLKWVDTLAREQVSLVPTVVLFVAGLSLLLKTYFAVSNPGFYSGDDVEIHEMTLGYLLGQHWPVWDIRNPAFPFAVVYPAQWLVRRLHGDDIGALVLAGRIAVALLSTATLWCVWRAARQDFKDATGYALLAVILVAAAQSQIAFGSSELPRPVSTALVCAAFSCLTTPSTRRVLVAGLALGLAAACRFSEAVFILPAALCLLFERRWSGSALLLLTSVAVAGSVLGVADAWYWGQPFHSLRAIVDYTVVERLSSRGYQSWWWYLTHAGDWINPAILALAVVGAALSRSALLWVAVPILILSALPHKEARYLIPVVPFVCILAVHGARRIIRTVQLNDNWRWLAALLIVGVSLGVAHDVGRYRLPRTNGEVQAARVLALHRDETDEFLIEQAWRFGGHLYFGSTPVVDLDPARLADPSYLATQVHAKAYVVLKRDTVNANPGLERVMQRRGLRHVTLAALPSDTVWANGR
jgi:hypothetical protein